MERTGLNCNRGDLALVIEGLDAGKMVTCLEPLPAGFTRDDLPPGWPSQKIHEEAGPLWRVDRPLAWGEPEPYIRLAPDKYLMPIRPDPIDLSALAVHDSRDACPT